MDRALWGLAIVVDVLGLVATWPFFTPDPDVASIIWNVILFSIFTALLLLLLKPRAFSRQHARLAAKVLCSAVPAAALLGSLDSASISGLEAVAIVVALLAGWLNWIAFNGYATSVDVRAA